MPQTRVVGISGNITRPSRTRAFVDHIVHRLAVDAGASAQTFDIEDFGASLLPARRLDELAPEARYVVGQILAADILVVASPTFKGSYTGLFKHVFDLLDPSSLRGKPVILAATGGRGTPLADGGASVAATVRLLRGIGDADCDLRLRQGLCRRRSRLGGDPCPRRKGGR